MSDTTSAVRAGGSAVRTCGIEIVAAGTHSVEAGNSLFLLIGRTYQHKEIIKSMGGRWLPGPKAWSTSSYGHAKKIVNEILAGMSVSVGGAERHFVEPDDDTMAPMSERRSVGVTAAPVKDWLHELPPMAYAPRLGRLSRLG